MATSGHLARAVKALYVSVIILLGIFFAEYVVVYLQNRIATTFVY